MNMEQCQLGSIRLTLNICSRNQWTMSHCISAPAKGSLILVVAFDLLNSSHILEHISNLKTKHVSWIVNLVRRSELVHFTCHRDSVGREDNLPKNNRRRVAWAMSSSGGVPNNSIMQANCSTSFSPGNKGYPVYNSARIQPVTMNNKVKVLSRGKKLTWSQVVRIPERIFYWILYDFILLWESENFYLPRLHMSIAVPYDNPSMTSGER